MAKFCSNCGTMLGEGASFCPECGTPVPSASQSAYLPDPVSGPENPAPVEEFRYDPVVEPIPDLVYDPAPQPLPGAEKGAAEAQPLPGPAEPPAAPPVPPQGNSGQDPYGYPPQQYSGVYASGGEVSPGKKPVSTIGFMLLQLLYAIPVIGFFASLVMAIAPENKNLKHHALANFLWKIILLALLIFSGIRFAHAVEKAWNEIGHNYSYHWEAGDLNELWDSLKDGDVSGILSQLEKEQ